MAQINSVEEFDKYIDVLADEIIDWCSRNGDWDEGETEDFYIGTIKDWSQYVYTITDIVNDDEEVWAMMNVIRHTDFFRKNCFGYFVEYNFGNFNKIMSDFAVHLIVTAASQQKYLDKLNARCA